MTDQLERDLAQMFARQADETDVPPVPLDLFTAETPTHWGRRAAIGLVAAAAVAAIAVPLGLNARNDDDVAPPTKDPDPVHGLELPYISQGELHIDDVSLPVDPNSWLEIAGSSVLVATSESDGTNIRWQRLVGQALEDLPHLDAVNSIEQSYDGALVAAPTGGQADSVRVWDTASGDVVDTFELATPPALEDPVMVGFDAAGFLYWHDGALLKARTPAGDVVTVDTGAGNFAGIAPGGILVRFGNSDTVTIGAVREDGSVSLGEQVPVSASATWRDTTTVAYQGVGTGGVYVFDATTGKQTEVTVPDRPYVLPVGWSGDELVVTAYGEGTAMDVVAVDPATGDQRRVFSFGTDVPYPFASIGGTGAL
ncbi:hypothetical protein [Nocardioides sp. WS12]|uniref:hypothetical protein n=1 Tax=Nocardioides sp. WS12 TaxID=2486272 RepID=UPI0015FDE57F|nr:hypothetical protein [Nocardioides sp. WS12]